MKIKKLARYEYTVIISTMTIIPECLTDRKITKQIF